MTLEEIFMAAVEKAPADRPAYLDAACGGDAKLRAQADALLRSHEEAGSVLEQPLFRPEPTADHPSAADGPGGVVGPYKLVQEIGEGGMGTVFLAQQQEPVKRLVALKVIKAGMDSRQVLARFEAERQALALMDHPNIAKVFDAGATPDGRPYFVMELVKGVPITRYCDEKRLTPRERLELFVQVCHAVQHAHQKGVIHRDIKPTNVLVAPYDGRPVVKVIDFGVAKAAGQPLTEKTLVTGFGAVVGTPEYMSPEQAELNNQDIDTRSDIYSLGVLLYELLTGTTPLTKKRVKEAALLEVLRLVREEEAARPSTRLSTTAELPSIAANRGTEPVRLTRLVRGELDWIVMKALDKDRNRRYETANGFAVDVGRYLANEPVQACPPSTWYRLRKFVDRNRRAVVVVAAFVLLLIAATGVSLVLADRARHEATQAASARNDAQLSEQKAQTEAAIAIEVSGFWQSIVSQASPWKQGNPHLPLRVLLEDASRQVAGRFESRPLIEASIRETLGTAFVGLLLHDRAVEHFRRALELRRREQGEDAPQTIVLLSALGEALAHTSRFQEAEPILKKAVEQHRQAFGERDKRTVLALTYLTDFYVTTGQTASAEPLVRQLLEQAQLLTRDDHAEFNTAIQIAAAFHIGKGEHAKAKEILESALARTRREHGDTYAGLLILRAKLLFLAMSQGKLAGLEVEARELLTVTTKEFGPHNVLAIELGLNLTDIYARLGKFPEAEGVAAANYATCQRYLGDVHPATQVVRRQLAGVYDLLGRLADSERLLTQVLAWQEHARGAEDVQTLETVNAIGANLLAQKKYAEAEILFTNLEKILRAKHGDTQPNVLLALQNLAMALDGQNKLPAAEKRWEELLERCRASAGGGAFLYDSALSSMGRNRVRQGKHAEAEAPLRECVELRKKIAADSWRRFNAESLLGGSLLGQKKYPEAEKLLLSGYEGMKAREKTIDAMWRHLLIDAAERLVLLYEATGAQDKARQWLTELETHRGQGKIDQPKKK